MKAKISLVLAGATALYFTPLRAAPEPSSSTGGGIAAQEEIKKIEQERNEALLKHGTATLDRMTSDDYTFIDQRGECERTPRFCAVSNQGVSTTTLVKSLT